MNAKFSIFVVFLALPFIGTPAVANEMNDRAYAFLNEMIPYDPLPGNQGRIVFSGVDKHGEQCRIAVQKATGENGFFEFDTYLAHEDGESFQIGPNPERYSRDGTFAKSLKIDGNYMRVVTRTDGQRGLLEIEFKNSKEIESITLGGASSWSLPFNITNSCYHLVNAGEKFPFDY